MQIAPPSITKPFSILGSTTRMNGGAKGKLSGKMRCRRMLGMFNSSMSCARGDSGSRWNRRTCHSNKLSFTNSACNHQCWREWWVVKINRIIADETQLVCKFACKARRRFIYRKDFLAAIALGLLKLSEFLHQPFGSDCGVNFGRQRKLRFGAVAGRNCATVDERKRREILIQFRSATTWRRLKVMNDNYATFRDR